MKKSKLLVLSIAIFGLAACHSNNSVSTSEQPSSPSVPSVSTGPESSQGSTSTSTPGSEQTSPSTPTPPNPSAARALFREALHKDYSNVTVYSYQQYYDGEDYEEDYEFVDNDYIVDFAYTLAEAGYDRADCYSYYHIDEDGKSWLHFEKDASNPNSKSGWLNKGASNADLSIWKTYFYLPMLLENITENDVSYSNGVYYVTTDAKIDELNYSAFGYAWFNDIIDIAFVLENGYISKIWGFCDSSSDPVNFVQIQLFNFGTTVLPPEFNDITPFSEETKMEYWQYKGWEHDYQRAYYTNAHAEVITSELESDEDHDVIIDVDKKFEVRYDLTPEAFNPWDVVKDEDKVVTWHYDETVLEMTYSNKSRTKTFRGIGGGTTEVYVSVNGENGPIESEHIVVKVIGLKEQDKTDAIYDFVWAGLEETHEEGNENDKYYNVLASNAVTTSKGLFDIKAGYGVTMNDGRNAENNKYFKSGQQYLLLQPSNSNVMHSTKGSNLYFDFGEQQVSQISFNYGLFWANHLSDLKTWLNKFTIRTYNNDGDVVEQDFANEIKNNASAEFIKNFEYEFAPASKVEIIVYSNMIGKSMSLAIDSVCFMANDDCHDYIPPEDVEVESISVTPASANIFTGKTVQLNALVSPQNAFDKTLTWHIEDGKDNVISLDNGLVTGLEAGTAQVWATSVNGVESNKAVITVVNMPDLGAYAGNIYQSEDNDNTLKVVDESTAIYSTFSQSVEATLVDYNGTQFIFENEDGEGFKVEFYNSSAHVREFKYLSNGEIKTTGGTAYCDLVKKMTSFSLSMNSNSVDEDTVYDVQIGDTRYLTVAPKPSEAKITVSFESSNDQIANVSLSSNTNVGVVVFKDSGEVTIKVVVVDLYGIKLEKEVKFNVAAKVFPNESNWDVKADKNLDDIKVGNQVQFSVNWKDDSINTDKTVTWTVSDTEVASITRAGVLTAKSEGEVTVTASVMGENNVPVTKSLTFTVSSAEEGALPDEACGTWHDVTENGFDFTVNSDGSAVMVVYGEEEFHFNFTGMNGSYYVFECEEDSSIILELWVKSDNTANLAPSDGEMVVIGDYYMWGYGADVAK
ncbi:MAG: Ig-like domain-containing protein [Erysipelotrichales bacterium]|nr:Ig-like domain-containing protein [Erysipelotrichales bacterium]